jgi:hypothetical protein
MVMQSMRLVFSLPAAAALIAVALATSVGAHAQTCASPVPIAAGAPAWASTCGAQTFTSGDLSGPGAVLTFSLDQPGSVYFTLSSTPGFEPQVCVTDSAGECGTGPCLATGDASTPAILDGLPAGSYRALVTASPFSTPGSCGMFGIIEDVMPDDTILANGFD